MKVKLILWTCIMLNNKINKCCEEFYKLVNKIRGMARTVNGTIYLDELERKELTNWIEANEKEIVNCSQCGAVVKKWIEEHYIVGLDLEK